MIEWRETYSVGVVKLDEQHKNLFQYCNDLEQGLKSKVISKQVVDGALKFLGAYIHSHFGQEESCMHKYSCPIAEKNKIAHLKFIDTFETFQRTISQEGDNEVDLRGLHYFLEHWLTEHICKIDSQLKPCVQEKH